MSEVTSWTYDDPGAIYRQEQGVTTKSVWRGWERGRGSGATLDDETNGALVDFNESEVFVHRP